MKAFYITTAIDYTNAPPHIGHAYEKVLADVIARYRRLRGGQVYFLSGVDQHGQKVKQSAEKAGLSPHEFAVGVTAKFRELWATLGVAYDGWAETTDPRHEACVRAILQDLHDKGQLYKARHEGFYSVRQEQFLTDKERGPDGEFGEEWGQVMHLEEENWYFRLSDHRDWLVRLLGARPGLVTPAFRQVELRNAADKISGDLCISRPKERLSWGIELPFDPEFVTYVWFDALINYISFAGYRAAPEDGLPDFTRLWPADLHVIGKDILVPAHGIYWLIMLHAMGIEDDRMPGLLVHGWWNISGSKMSKSLGNSIDPATLAERYGADPVRYYLMRDIATGQDADFSEERLRQRYQADLANDLGNLLNRALNMAGRYRDGIVRNTPCPDPDGERLDALARETLGLYIKRMDDLQIHAALDAVWALVTACNVYVETSAPWKLAKDPAAADRLDAVLYRLADHLRLIALLASPVLAGSMAKIWEQLGFTPDPCAGLERAASARLPDGHALGKPVPLFPRLP